MDDAYLLNPHEAVEYVRSATTLFPPQASLEISEIAGNQRSVEGYINAIYRIADRETGRSVVLKQYRRFIKGAEAVFRDLPLSLARMRVEIEAFKLWNAICPGSVPELYAWDEERAILIMEDLSHLKLARFEFARRKQFPEFARQVGQFLGRTAFFTSDLYLDPGDKKRLVQGFTNPEYRQLIERVIFDRFLDPALDEPVNPGIRDDLQAFLADEQVLLELLRLKEAYVVRAQSLIHNDFHTANIFLGPEEMKVFDAEGAFIGPTAYDIGQLYGNLILSCMSLQVLDDIGVSEKIDYEDYLLRTMEELTHEFERSFCAAWDECVRPLYRASRLYRADYLRRILQDAAGYAAILALSRIYDPGMSYDFSRIPDLQQRAVGQRLVIQTARQLLLDRERFQRVEDITAMLKQIKIEHKVKSLVREKLRSRQPVGTS